MKCAFPIAGVLKWGGVHAREGDRPLLRALYDPPETLDCAVPGQRASKEQIQALLQNSRGAAYCSYTGWGKHAWPLSQIPSYASWIVFVFRVRLSNEYSNI